MDRRSLRGRHVAVGVGGGIAAYKACELVRELMRAGATVRVAMTEAATAFVGPMTFQALSGHPVLTHSYDPAQEATFGHLDLSRWADLYVVAPGTADLIARLRAGMANDAVTASFLAFRGPAVIAPAMNVAMFENRITQENLSALTVDGRISLAGPDAGLLACGDVGAGRLTDIETLVDAIALRASTGELSGKSVLLTAGPTREYLDPVRFISNPSTGKMGLAIAEIARARGAEVTVVLGPASAPIPEGVSVVSVTTAEEMAREVLARVASVDFFVATAAVSDYRPEQVLAQKQKKSQGSQPLTLVRTPDVLAQAVGQLPEQGRRPIVCGFAAETERVLEYAERKLQEKNLDVIVANDLTVPGAGFASDTNHVTILTREGLRQSLDGSKRDVAKGLWDILTRLPPRA
jgi:phosphopantothenoylcysteine decarboxylase / phosphopantothenate---cysteine ligase